MNEDIQWTSYSVETGCVAYMCAYQVCGVIDAEVFSMVNFGRVVRNASATPIGHDQEEEIAKWMQLFVVGVADGVLVRVVHRCFGDSFYMYTITHQVQL